VASTADGAETRYLVDAVQPYPEVVLEYTPSGLLTASYVYGNRLISQLRAGTQSFYVVDALGSTRALTNGAGIVTDRYFYDAFGRVLAQMGSTSNSYMFTGEPRDKSLGLDYLRARWLDPDTGRFASRDPIAVHVGVPLFAHPYLYAGADPVNRLDPSGKLTLTEQLVVATIMASLGSYYLTYGLTGSVRKATITSIVVLTGGLTLAYAAPALIGGGAAVAAGPAVPVVTEGVEGVPESLVARAQWTQSLVIQWAEMVATGRQNLVASQMTALWTSTPGRQAIIMAHRLVSLIIQYQGENMPKEHFAVFKYLQQVTGYFLKY
jgi:RHS repeat-associated protein